MADDSTTSTQVSAGFFDLPTELRDVIYFYAVASEFEIDLDCNDCSQPPLVRTCRQIRDEAIAMFYEENCFSVEVVDCKFEPQPEHWFWRAGVRRTAYPSGRCVWSNLKEWLRPYYEGRAVYIMSEVDESSPLIPAVKAGEIVERLKGAGLDWAFTEKILESFKEDVESEAFDGTFGDDSEL